MLREGKKKESGGGRGEFFNDSKSLLIITLKSLRLKKETSQY